MSDISFAKSLNDLKKSYGVKTGKHQRYAVTQENIPAQFRFLFPYLSFYCIADEELREQFCESLPEKAFTDLIVAVKKAEPELTYWLGGDEAQKKIFSSEYLALSILRQVSEIYQPILKSSSQLSEEKIKQINEILLLDEEALKKRWQIPDDTFKRYNISVENLPEKLKPLKFVVRLLAIEDDDNMSSFKKQLNKIAREEIELIKKRYSEAITHYITGESIKFDLSNEALAIDRLRLS